MDVFLILDQNHLDSMQVFQRVFLNFFFFQMLHVPSAENGCTYSAAAAGGAIPYVITSVFIVTVCFLRLSLINFSLLIIFFFPQPPPLSRNPLNRPFLAARPSVRPKAKVRELEEKCRSQSEQFNLLSKELEKFRLQAGKFDILGTDALTICDSPGSPGKTLTQLLNGLAGPLGKGRTYTR